MTEKLLLKIKRSVIPSVFSYMYFFDKRLKPNIIMKKVFQIVRITNGLKRNVCNNGYLKTLVTVNLFNVNDFKKLLKIVNKYTDESVSPVFGLEDTKHLEHTLATLLLNNGYTVKHVNSTLTYTERNKFPIISKNVMNK